MKVTRIKLIDMEKTLKKSVKLGVRAVADEGVNIASHLVPVDTGHLKQSLGAESTSDKTAIYGTNVEYGLYQEFGTSKVKAQPYLRPSADELKTKGSKILAKVIKGAIHG